MSAQRKEERPELNDLQIRALRNLALTIRDQELADICDVAMAPEETKNGEGLPLLSPAGVPITRTEARAEVSRAIELLDSGMARAAGVR